jgi:predicted double-glycine peptidase
MRESKFTEMVPQKTDFSCGAAALATILKYGYAEDISEKQIIKEMLKINDPEVIKNKGFSLLDLKNYLKTRGMKGKGYKVKPGVLKILKIPVIVLLDTGGYKHFVVVKKSRNGKVYVSDPALGHKIIPENEFVEGWNNIVFVVMGKPFAEDSPLLALNDPFKVNRENIIKGAQRKVDAIDFGLIPSKLF